MGVSVILKRLWYGGLKQLQVTGALRYRHALKFEKPCYCLV